MKSLFVTLFATTVLFIALQAAAITRYVNLDNPSPAPPYTNWATASTNIQVAIDVAEIGDLILVTNGIYTTGGRAVFNTMINRVAITKAVTVQSVNGASVSIIRGQQEVRAAYLTNGAKLVGFTLTGGTTRSTGDELKEQCGGGVWCESGLAELTDCVVSNNAANNVGGGVYYGTVRSSVIVSNRAVFAGGGVAFATVSSSVITSNLSQLLGGGAHYGALSNCTLVGNTGIYGGGANSAMLTNCTLSNNLGNHGGGAYGGTMVGCLVSSNSAQTQGGGAAITDSINCTFIGNQSSSGGGVAFGTLVNCTLAGNWAGGGGGADNASLVNCLLTNNQAAGFGGGASLSTVNNSALVGNTATEGGGAYMGTINNSWLSGNLATNVGGGTSRADLNNCTLTGNLAGKSAGGANNGLLRNSIAYYNFAPSEPNHAFCTVSYSCTTPLPTGGIGNLAADPQLASPSHLSAASPCRATGSGSYTSGSDINGETWANPPSIGCDDYRTGSVTGAVSVAILVDYSNVATGFEVNFTAQINGRVSASRWNFGSGVLVSNRPYASHAWNTAASYAVELRAYNESFPGGVSATAVVHVVQAPVHYVSQGSPGPAPPFASWDTAATNIQAAIDVAAVPGALVLVSNGVYATGGLVVRGTVTNRVVVNKPLIVQSVNGPAVTVIRGYQVPGTTNGDAAIRCVYLASRAALSGFMLTNGATRGSNAGEDEASGGGVWCEIPGGSVSNCVIVGNSARYGGGVSRGKLYNCTITRNTSPYGGGAYYAIADSCSFTQNDSIEDGGAAYGGGFSNCQFTANTAFEGGGTYKAVVTTSTFSSNSAYYGGGAYDGTVTSSTFNGNLGVMQGGGVSETTLQDCTLNGNRAGSGGGAHRSTVRSTIRNCIFIGNQASDGGGGYGIYATNCAFIGNVATNLGGGVQLSTLRNCTLTGNYAGGAGGGANQTTMTNSIAYFNLAPSGANHAGSTLGHCCTTPLPTNGIANMAADPQLASMFHLSAGSPCLAAGNGALATGMDIDGEGWNQPPAIGCDEYRLGSTTGALTVAIQAEHTNVATGFEVSLFALIDGRLSASRWNFGDGTIISNRPYATHRWTVAGAQVVTLTAFNESFPQGVSTTLIIQVVAQPVHYVVSGNSTPVSPFSSWTTAATNIQAAVDAATVPGALVLVSNGVYASGGRAVVGTMTNRLAVTKPLVVRSVNGPAVTAIHGYQLPATTNGNGAVRCVYLTNGASLSGFTLTNGATRITSNSDREESGGGVWCEFINAAVSNCVVIGNAAANRGGGAFGGIHHHSLFTSNRAVFGGGVYGGTVLNGTIVGNRALSQGGGVVEGYHANSVVYYNFAPTGSNHWNASLGFCCTWPLPAGLGNFTNPPFFLSLAAGNLRLQSNSPCINAGHNQFVSTATDLDGLPRIIGGTVDIGAYEFQSPASILSYAWAQQYGLPTDGTADYTDLDGDGRNNWQEWRADTVPTNALSVFRFQSITNVAGGINLTWQSTTTRSYWLERSTHFGGAVPFQTVATNIAGINGVKTFTDFTATNSGPYFFRVGVQP